MQPSPIIDTSSAPSFRRCIDAILPRHRATGFVAPLVLLAVVGACAPRPALRTPEPADAGDVPVPDAASVRDVAPPPADARPPADAAPPLDQAPAPRDVGREAPVDVPPEAPEHKTVLLVVGAPMSAGDTKMRARLQAKGFTVVLGDDGGGVAQANGAQAVLISASSASAMVAAKYIDVKVPVICLEAFVLDQMKMTGARDDMDLGEQMGTQVTIALAGHPIAAGLTGTVTVTTAAAPLSWGSPAPGATRIATVANMTGKVAAFVYPTGTMMVGAMAPAPRVGLFVTDDAADRLSPAGWQIFDAAVEWAISAP